MNNKLTQDQKIAGTGVHEFFHATNPKQLAYILNGKQVPADLHQEAWKKEAEAIKEFGEHNKKKE